MISAFVKKFVFRRPTFGDLSSISAYVYRYLLSRLDTMVPMAFLVGDQVFHHVIPVLDHLLGRGLAIGKPRVCIGNLEIDDAV